MLVEQLCLDGLQKLYLDVEPDVLVVGGRRASLCGGGRVPVTGRQLRWVQARRTGLLRAAPVLSVQHGDAGTQSVCAVEWHGDAQARHIYRVSPSEDCAQADPLILAGRIAGGRLRRGT
ncbi:hypothetical protein GCM10010313_32920 [Streptomyces violarus]|nr:hypothetical protein GCM10010313_32920 [Streptomyces violarus]